MRSRASCSRSSRVPKRRQSAGHALTQAGGTMFALFLGERLSVARHRQRLFGPVGAMSTLLYLRSERIPFRRWYSPRACPDAVTATNALVGIVNDWPVRSTIERCRRTGGGTCRFEAVQTSPHREKIMQPTRRLLIGKFVKGNQRKGLRAQSRWILKTQVVIQLGFLSVPVVPLLASNLTR